MTCASFHSGLGQTWALGSALPTPTGTTSPGAPVAASAFPVAIGGIPPPHSRALRSPQARDWALF